MTTRDPANSMSLIFDAMRNPLDPAYAEATKNRPPESKPRHRTGLLFVALLLLGLLLSAGATALRQPAGVVKQRHNQLVGQVQSAQEKNDATAASVATLRADVTRLRSSALSRSDQHATQQRLDAATRAAAGTPVDGHGVSIRLSNPTVSSEGADSNPRTNDAMTTVTSTDLQQVVNALFEAGASDIAINDQRLSSLTAIRFAGSAILVNYRPLTTPYTVKALGPSNLQGKFSQGFGGQYLEGLKRSGFSVDVTTTQVHLPASPASTISHAEVVPESRPQASTAVSEEASQ